MSFFNFVSQKLWLLFQNVFFYFEYHIQIFPILRKGVIFFIRASHLFSFSFYLEVFQIINGKKQLFFQNIIRFG